MKDMHFKSSNMWSISWNNAHLCMCVPRNYTVRSRLLRRPRADCAVLLRTSQVQNMQVFSSCTKIVTMVLFINRCARRRIFKKYIWPRACVHAADISRMMRGFRAASANRNSTRLGHTHSSASIERRLWVPLGHIWLIVFCFFWFFLYFSDLSYLFFWFFRFLFYFFLGFFFFFIQHMYNIQACNEIE